MASTHLGYWGEPDSLMDFCEGNYVVTYYIAEFFNTLSSIPMFVHGLIGLILTHQYATKEFRFKLCYLSLMFIGIGSSLFHATLRFKYQLLDELPMLLFSAVALYTTGTLEDRMGITNWRLAILLIVSVVIDAILYLRFQFWIIFAVGYSINVAIITYIGLRYYRHLLGKWMVYAILCYYGAFMCWLIDMFFCNSVQHLHLHRYCMTPYFDFFMIVIVV